MYKICAGFRRAQFDFWAKAFFARMSSKEKNPKFLFCVDKAAHELFRVKTAKVICAAHLKFPHFFGNFHACRMFFAGF
ncbi:MAG: hypothetical protein DBX55_05490 [Verrucomicrobia bacterium]|nr:MAG: hypothetical protein DBX55_05490 [Verrucomicrobiota bacterium]